MAPGSVLIVDDDPLAVQILGAMLTEVSQVRFALSGKEGMKSARASPPDLILLDANMPDMSGLDVCDAIKSDPDLSAIPVIFITQQDGAEVELQCLEAGAVDFISKPPKALLVQARVRNQLRLKQLSDQLRLNANTDALTGAANRRQFDELFQREWDRARRSCESLSLLMVDIDHFKLFNDHHGHQQGDACLKMVAQTMMSLVNRPADIVARFGGEEFVVLLPDTCESGARHVADMLVNGVSQRGIAHGASPTAPHVTVSVGGATWLGAPPETGRKLPQASDLLGCADAALYEAKRAGRACWRFSPLQMT